MALLTSVLLVLPTTPASAAVVERKDPNVVDITRGGEASPTSTVIPVSGGSAAQRRVVTSYLKEWGRYTNIGSVRITKGSCGGRAWGRTAIQSRGYAREICVKANLGSGHRFEYTFAHELAHAAQSFAFRGVGWSGTFQRFNKVYGGGAGMRSLDNAADCASEVMTGKSVRKMAGQVPYKSGCSARQHSTALKYLRGQSF